MITNFPMDVAILEFAPADCCMMGYLRAQFSPTGVPRWRRMGCMLLSLDFGLMNEDQFSKMFNASNPLCSSIFKKKTKNTVHTLVHV